MEPRIEPHFKRFARALRKRMPPAEVALWQQLRDGALDGLKFRRQVPLHGYIVDFCCLRARVVVEVDGDSHTDLTEADAARDATLGSHGYAVLRFTNLEVAESLEGVVEQIAQACREQRDSGTPT